MSIDSLAAMLRDKLPQRLPTLDIPPDLREAHLLTVRAVYAAALVRGLTEDAEEMRATTVEDIPLHDPISGWAETIRDAESAMERLHLEFRMAAVRLQPVRSIEQPSAHEDALASAREWRGMMLQNRMRKLDPEDWDGARLADVMAIWPALTQEAHEAARARGELAAARRAPKLNDLELKIQWALREHGSLKGEELAAKCGTQYGGRFKEIAGAMVRHGIIGNTKRRGYYLHRSGMDTD